jgi:hypothetical protein
MKPTLYFFLLLFFILVKPVFSQTLTGDPMVFRAYKEIYNRQPNALEVNIKNYNGGNWYSYEELKNLYKRIPNLFIKVILNHFVCTPERSCCYRDQAKWPADSSSRSFAQWW